MGKKKNVTETVVVEGLKFWVRWIQVFLNKMACIENLFLHKKEEAGSQKPKKKKQSKKWKNPKNKRRWKYFAFMDLEQVGVFSKSKLANGILKSLLILTWYVPFLNVVFSCSLYFCLLSFYCSSDLFVERNFDFFLENFTKFPILIKCSIIAKPLFSLTTKWGWILQFPISIILKNIGNEGLIEVTRNSCGFSKQKENLFFLWLLKR